MLAASATGILIGAIIAPAVSFGVLEPNTATIDMTAVYTAVGTKIVASEPLLSSGVTTTGMTKEMAPQQGPFC